PFFDILQPQKYPFGEIKVRKAMQLSINSKELADSMYGGIGGQYALFYISPSAYFFDATVLKTDPYDPEQAKKLMADAGYAGGFGTKIWQTRAGVLPQLIQATSGYWGKIGVRAEIANMDYTAFLSTLVPNIKPELYGTIWELDSGAFYGSDGLVSGYHSKKGTPKNINNPQLDDLIDKIPQTLDPVEKKRIALEAARLAQQEYNTMRIVTIPTDVAVSSKIKEVSTGVYTRVIPGFQEMIKNLK
ncbi:MAG: ABC transporter substrate-binding protein, partial [Dehalococcoidia bacterium]|nr:ABC transporter substrate-binding protein [Dehalococcoidia bacterium]